MALNLSLNHPTFELKDKICEISQPFFHQFGFSYFQYLRCFSDGSVSLLSTHTGALEYFQKNDDSPVIFSSFTQDHEKVHSYWFLWDDELPKEPVALVREKFGVHHGLTLVRRSKYYYDMIAVGLPKEHPNASSFYLNKLKIIEHFIDSFDKNYHDLIAFISKNPIALPTLQRDLNYQKICLPKGKIPIATPYGNSHITAQELACLRHLLHGASNKETAQILDISARTVETYLLRIKQRTGLYSRADLERLLAICQ